MAWMSWSGSYSQGCQDWEMHSIFQTSKVVSLWYQTIHLIWLKTYQLNFSKQTATTTKPYQIDFAVKLMCPHRQNDRPGSHKHHFWNQAKDLPSCRCASFQLSPLCFTGIWRLLIWFWRLGPFSNVTAGFFNNVESLIWDSELFFFFKETYKEQSLKMCSWNTVNSLALKSTPLSLTQKAMIWWNRRSNITCVCIHLFIHSNVDWTPVMCQAMVGVWG